MPYIILKDVAFVINSKLANKFERRRYAFKANFFVSMLEPTDLD